MTGHIILSRSICIDSQNDTKRSPATCVTLYYSYEEYFICSTSIVYYVTVTVLLSLYSTTMLCPTHTQNYWNLIIVITLASMMLALYMERGRMSCRGLSEIVPFVTWLIIDIFVCKPVAKSLYRVLNFIQGCSKWHRELVGSETGGQSMVINTWKFSRYSDYRVITNLDKV